MIIGRAWKFRERLCMETMGYADSVACQDAEGPEAESFQLRISLDMLPVDLNCKMQIDVV